jgi:SPW repeat-containing protein
MKGISWVNVALGVWLLIAPVALHASGLAVRNDVLMGIIVLVAAAVSLAAAPSNHLLAWINVAAGLWLLFSPWGLHFNGQIPIVANNAIAGALIIIFALVRASAGRPAPAI